MGKDYTDIKPSDSKYGVKDVGQPIAAERYEAVIDRIFTPESRPARPVSVADALTESAFN